MKRVIINVLVECSEEVWMKLQYDVYKSGFVAEFCEFVLENPGLSVFEIDRQFRNEWDL